LLLLLLILSSWERIRAGESLVPPSVTVASVYWDPVLKSWGNEVAWIFSPAELPQGARGYALEVKRPEATSPTALLRYDGQGRLTKVTRFLSEHGRTRRIAESFAGPVALSDGFPVPFDYLAPGDRELRGAKVRKRAGGSVFSQQLHKLVTEMTFAEALAKGLVREEVKDFVAGRPLRMIEMSDEETIRVRQLWAEGLSWWVYEENPFRKSWLVGIQE